MLFTQDRYKAQHSYSSVELAALLKMVNQGHSAKGGSHLPVVKVTTGSGNKRFHDV